MDKILELNYLLHLPEDKLSRILDFGCGEGRVLKFLEDQGYENFLGVDIDSEVLARLPQNFRAKTEFLGSLSLFVESHYEYFDCIILKDVIYYFTRECVVQNLRLILRCLKPGGNIIVEVFNGAQLTAGYTAAKDLGIKTVFTETSLKQLFTASNLKIMAIFEQMSPQKGARWWFYRAGQKLYYLMLKLVFVFERGVDSHNPKILGKSIIGVCRKN